MVFIKERLLNCLLILSSRKGSILAHTLVLFFIFLSIYTPVLTLTLYVKTQSSLAEKAFKRIDMEIAALSYYHEHKDSLQHDDAIYEYNHWITYWHKDNKLIIWFDGLYDYQIEFTKNDEDNFIKRTYVYD